METSVSVRTSRKTKWRSHRALEHENFGSVAWSRVQELRDIDEHLVKVSKALESAVIVHERLHAQIRDALEGAIDVAVGTGSHELSLARSFTYFLSEVVSILTSVRARGAS